MENENTPKKRHIGRIILAVFAALIIAGLLYLSLVPLDLTGHRERIESVIESKTGRKVRFDTLVIKVLPSPDITMTNIKAFEGDKEVLSAGHLHARLSLLPYLSGRTVLQTLELKDLNAFIVRDKEGNVNLVQFIKGKEEKKPPEEKKKEEKGKFAIKSFDLEDGKVRFIDDFVPQRAVFDVTGIKGFLHESPKGYTYRLEGKLLPDSPFTVSGEGNPFNMATEGTWTLKNLDLNRFEPYIKKTGVNASVAGFASAETSFSISEKAIFAKTFFNYRDLSAGYPAAFENPVASPSGSAVASLSKKEDLIEISITDIKLNLPDFKISGSAGMSGPTESRVFSISLSTTPIPLTTFRTLTPVRALPQNASKKINNIKPLGGTVTLKNMTASGTATEFKNGEIFKRPEAFSLAVNFDRLNFRYRGLREKFSDITGGFVLKNNIMTVSDMHGRYSKEVIESLKGQVKDLMGNANYGFSVKARGEAGETLGIIKDLYTESGAAEKLDKISTSGDIGLNLNLTGALKTKAPFRYSGSGEIKNAAFHYEGMPIGLDAINGGVTFDNKRLNLNNMLAASEQSTFAVNGYIEDYAGESPFFNLNAAGAISGDTIAKATAGTGAEELKVAGLILFRAAAIGRKESFDADLSVDTTPAYLEYPKAVRKEQDFPLTATGSVKINAKELTLKKADLKFGSSSIHLSGDMLRDMSSYKFSANSPEVRLTDLSSVSAMMDESFESEGTITFTFNASKEKENARYNGSVKIRDGRFKTPLFANPVEKIIASASFEGNRAKAVIDTLMIGRTEIGGTVDVTDIANRAIQFNIFSPFFYTEDLVPKKTEEEKAKEEEAKKEKEKKPLEAAPKKPFSGTGTITFNQGSLFGQAFRDFYTEAVFTDRALYLNPVVFRVIDRGSIAGTFTYYQDPAEPLVFETALGLTNIHMGDMLSGFVVKKDVLSGDLQGKITLSAKRGAPSLLEGLNGSATLRSEKGRLWKFRFITDIFSLINILSIDELLKSGLPYKTLSGDFSVKDGIIFTDNLAFDSDSLKMSAIGEVDLPDSSIDSVLAVSPFVTIDKLISKIPIAGWIITGKDKSSLRIHFKIEGPLNDPSVMPVPIKSIEEGVFGVLERLIETPLELLTPD